MISIFKPENHIYLYQYSETQSSFDWIGFISQLIASGFGALLGFVFAYWLFRIQQKSQQLEKKQELEVDLKASMNLIKNDVIIQTNALQLFGSDYLFDILNQPLVKQMSKMAEKDKKIPREKWVAFLNKNRELFDITGHQVLDIKFDMINATIANGIFYKLDKDFRFNVIYLQGMITALGSGLLQEVRGITKLLEEITEDPSSYENVPGNTLLVFKNNYINNHSVKFKEIIDFVAENFIDEPVNEEKNSDDTKLPSN